MTKIISLTGGMQPTAPTIGTATDGGTGTTVSVAFTPSTYIGKGTITYTATSSPSGITATGSSSPITVTGLTTGTPYTFTVTGTTNYGVSSAASAASNSITPANPIAGSFDAIGSVTLGTAATTISFTGIPSNYKHLQIRGITRIATAGTQEGGGTLQFNGDTSGNYSYRILLGQGSAASAQSYASQTSIWIADSPFNTNPTNVFGTTIIDIYNYSDASKGKTVRALTGYDASGAGLVCMGSGGYFVSSVITSLSITSPSGNWLAGSTLALYGVK